MAASLIGTTGASMLLIRPLLDANRERKHKTHIVVFFILIVSNTGGLLTPLGDPPLYLGYLNGVPFFFTLRLFPAWLIAQALLLTMFFVWDAACTPRESAEDLCSTRLDRDAATEDGRQRSTSAWHWRSSPSSAAGTPSPWRELLFAIVIGTSFVVTPARVREANTFHYGPLREVALLFLGIFITMVPALEALRHHAPRPAGRDHHRACSCSAARCRACSTMPRRT